MKIAVLADTHDHVPNLEKALMQITGKADVIFHLGDFCAPFMAGLLSKTNLPAYLCLGNNDGDQIGLYELSGKNAIWTPLWKEFGETNIDKRKIAYCHYPKLGELLAKSGEYNAVFYGHTHIVRNEMIGKTLLLNPGAICGINTRFVLKVDGEKSGSPSYAIYDTQTNSAEIINIK